MNEINRIECERKEALIRHMNEYVENTYPSIWEEYKYELVYFNEEYTKGKVIELMTTKNE